jgi:hypothetical protein
MPKVLPSQLTDEEILALLDAEDQLWDEDTSKIFDYNDDIVPFLSNYQITPGTTPVSKKLIYKLYKAYSKQPLDQLNFTTQLGNYISHDRDHFLLNTDQFAISKYVYEAEKTRDKTKSLTFQKHFNWFLQEAKVEKGRTWIEGFILFYIYKDFCKSRRVNPKFGYVNFHKFLKLNFDYKRIKGNRSLWFRVDEQTATIFSEEECERIRQARTKETRGRKKETSGEAEETST